MIWCGECGYKGKELHLENEVYCPYCKATGNDIVVLPIDKNEVSRMTLEEILEKLHSPTEHAITLENGELTALLEELKELREENESLSAQVCDLQLAYNNELADGKKAKRLLKAAVEGFNLLGNYLDDNCPINVNCIICPLHRDINCKCWKHKDEALALIGEEGEQNG